MKNNIVDCELPRVTNKISELFYGHVNAYGRLSYYANDSLEFNFRTLCLTDNEYYMTCLSFDFKTRSFTGQFYYASGNGINFDTDHLKFKDIDELNNLVPNESYPRNIIESLRKQINEFLLKVNEALN
jgi:hypothetical protein